MFHTYKCKLVAIQDGQYMVYVFENLDEESTSERKYITCVRLPNWSYNDTIEIGEEGFLQCEFVTAGKTYYCVKTGEELPYQYSNCYFMNFIKIKEKINVKEFKF